MNDFYENKIVKIVSFSYGVLKKPGTLKFDNLGKPGKILLFPHIFSLLCLLVNLFGSNIILASLLRELK